MAGQIFDSPAAKPSRSFGSETSLPCGALAVERCRAMTGLPQVAARAAVALLVACAAMVAAAPGAAAHAEFLGSDPAPGARLAAAPERARLSFSEGVQLLSGGIRLLDGSGRPVPGEVAPRVSGHDVLVALPRLRPGGYVLAWRVVSADSHPVQGAVPFGVGTPAPATSGDAAVEATTTSSAGVVLGVLRWTGYVGTAVLVGVPLVLALCWSGAAVPRGLGMSGLGVVAPAGAGVVAGAALAGVLAYGPYVTGEGVSGRSLGTALESAYARAGIARALLAGVLVLVLIRLRGRITAAAAAVAGTLAAALCATFAVQGHAWAATPPMARALAVLTDAVHLAAMSVWLGGLAALVVLRPRAGFHDGVRPGRWSAVAASCVGVLALTGTLQGVRELPAVSALTDSRYGLLLTAKVVTVAAMLIFAVAARRLLLRGELGRDVRVLVGSELALGAAVLAVTAVLVATTPPADTAPLTPRTPPAARAVLPDGAVATITANPARLLRVVVAEPHGHPVRAQEVTAKATLPGTVEGLDVPLHPDAAGATDGVWTAHDTPLPFPGTWRVTVTVRRSELEAGVASSTLTVP